MGKKILTLNIGAATVTLAEFDIGGKAPVLLNYGTARLAASLDSGNASAILTPALHEIMRGHSIRPGKVALSISGQMAFLRCAAIPLAGGQEKFNTLIRYEIEQNIPFPIDEMVCDSQVLGETENGDKSVMIVASKVEQVESIVEAVKSAGFVPEIVDVAPISLINLLQSSPAYSGECSILLDIGAKTTSLSIIEGEKIYNRAIPVAGNTLTKEIAQVLGCTLDEAEAYKCDNAYVSMGGVTEDEDETLDRVSKVCRSVMTRLHAEITRSVNFYRSQQHGSMPVKLYLTGGTAMLPQIGEFFQDSLQIEVDLLRPFDLIGCASSVDTNAAAADSVYLGVAGGLALRAAGKAAISINLQPPSVLAAKKEAGRIPFVAVASATLAAAGALWFFVQNGELSSLQDENAAYESKRAELEGNKAYNQKQREAFEAEKTAATELSKRISRRDAYASRLNAVRQALEPDMWIARWEEKRVKVDAPKPDANTVRRTRGRSQAEPETFVTVSEVVVRIWKDRSEALSKESNGDTIQKIIRERLKKTGAFKDGGIETPSAPAYGKDGCLQEVVLKLQFKEP